MVETKSTFVFNEALILNQLFEDMEHGRLEISSVQTNRQLQENIYQAARQKMNNYLQQNKENVNSGLGKKNHGSFWNKLYSYDDGVSSESADDADKFGARSHSDVSESSSCGRFGYDSSSSGE
jgi:hypothetical protein